MQASLQGRAYTPVSQYAVALQPASSIVAVLRTKLLYEDRSALRVSFLLRDADGRSLVSSDGLIVRMVATGPLTTLLTSSPCIHGSVANPNRTLIPILIFHALLLTLALAPLTLFL